ncbi:hypothetical protein [Nonomuraea sp. NPDC005650]|uniref:hypothetical protein n=1 Tax=Nonomuraea sp. NPDC005650 TaxID=3157045 RepID=UPI0033A33B69
MAVDPKAQVQAVLDQAEELAHDSRHPLQDGLLPQGPQLLLRLVAALRRILQEYEGAARREQIEFVEQREAPPELPPAELLHGLRRACALAYEALIDPRDDVGRWLEEWADHWEKGNPPPMRHPLVAGLGMSVDVVDVDAFQRGVLHGPQGATVVLTARLYDNTTVGTSRKVRMQVTPQ